MVAIRVEPAHVVRMPGESYTYVAIGSMSDGTERNLTEDVLWSCSFGCEAPNEPGDRGRVVATTLSPPYPPPFSFYSDVWATDPATGIASQYVIFEISSDPIPLVIYPQYTIIRELTFDYLTALALDEQGAYRNATQDVIWSSTDPSVAAVENHAEIRSRVDAVSPGVADIYATDPRSGAVSGPATFRIFGPLIGIDVHTRGRSIQNTRETMDVGEVVRALAWSIFEDGFQFEGFDPVTFTSSDPTVAVPDVIPQPTPLPGGPSYPDGPNFPRYHVLRGVAPGRIRLSARDDLSGVGSHDLGCEVLVTVRQPVSSLRLNPLKRSVGLDETVKLTALGVGSDGGTRNFTQRVVYTSSDPSVIVATNETGDRSKLVVVGPGTAVISAVDPATGFTTDASGGGTTITVRNERADGITVRPADTHTMLGTTPRFDAVAHYPSGKTAAVNESVVWTSGDPELANFYVWGVRNRIEPYAEGSTTVTATMPSLGLTSPAATLDDRATREPEGPATGHEHPGRRRAAAARHRQAPKRRRARPRRRRRLRHGLRRPRLERSGGRACRRGLRARRMAGSLQRRARPRPGCRHHLGALWLRLRRRADLDRHRRRRHHHGDGALIVGRRPTPPVVRDADLLDVAYARAAARSSATRANSSASA